MPWSSPITVVLCAALAPPAGPSSEWSDDGSAEAALLRKRVEAHDQAQAEQELGQRGLKFIEGDGGGGAPSDPGGGSPGQPDVPTPDDPGDSGPGGVAIDDLQRRADIERVVRQGRRLFMPGIIIATLGTIFSVAGIATIIKYPTPAVGGFLGVSLGIAAIGWPIAVVGIHKRRHPEKYLRNNVALSPTGFALRF
jgi:hypothetical protein